MIGCPFLRDAANRIAGAILDHVDRIEEAVIVLVADRAVPHLGLTIRVGQVIAHMGVDLPINANDRADGFALQPFAANPEIEIVAIHQDAIGQVHFECARRTTGDDLGSDGIRHEWVVCAQVIVEIESRLAERARPDVGIFAFGIEACGRAEFI